MKKKVVLKIHELLEEHNTSQRELGRRADIRHSAISEMANQQREFIYLAHIEKIAETFDVKDIRKIITIVDVDE
jgi:putative transcriptional regulator